MDGEFSLLRLGENQTGPGSLIQDVAVWINLGCVCFVGREGREKEEASGEELCCLDHRGRGG